MQAIIRLGNGQYYHTPIFGYYNDHKKAEDSTHSYVIVFDSDRTHLVKKPIFDPRKKPYLDLMVIITDDSKIGWNCDENGYGGVAFLPKNLALSLVQSGELPNYIKKKCLELVSKEKIEAFKPIDSECAIKKFMLITGSCHDARIERLEKGPDGSLYVLLDGIWGCKAELVFEGDVNYCTDSRNPEYEDPYWYGVSIKITDEYIYFVDCEDFEIEQLNDDDYCWFKAESLKYRIIPK